MSNPETRANVLKWLARRRVTVPDRPVGYMHRPEIAAQCIPTDHPLTLVHAPAGFGKTTLVAESCRAEAARGIPTAWLLVDEQDDEATLDTYLAFAFQQAGLDLGRLSPDSARVRESDRRIAIILRAIAADVRPWVLALDEVERVSESGLPVLNELFRGDVPNLRIVLTCRRLPLGLDIAWPTFDRAKVITAKDLRFSRREMTQFLGSNLSRREISRIATESDGWPIALHLEREKRESGHAERAQVADGVVKNRLESRIWSDMSEDERELVLDAGILEWMDAELVDEVLGGQDLMAKLRSLPGVAGLLQPVRGESRRVWRLHTLVRELCVGRRRRETPERYRVVHRRMAKALARRGDTVAAARHAADAEDAALVGEIVTGAGGVQLMFRQSSDRLVAVDRFIDEETLALFPALATVRIAALMYRSEFDEARKLSVATRKLLEANPDDFQLDCDLHLAEALLARDESVDSPRRRWAMKGLVRLVERPDVDPLTRAAMEYLQTATYNLRAEFDAASECAMHARRRLRGPESFYVAMALDFDLGQAEMARGMVREAMARYRRIVKTARKRLPLNLWQGAFGELLIQELELERNRVPAGESLQRILWHPASADMAVELGCEARGVDYALRVLEKIRKETRNWGPLVERHFAGLRVALLAGAGRVEDAEAHWREEALPESFGGCVDLARLCWREMEVICCARLRLCTARGDFEAGRRLVADLLAVTRRRGLRRTEMRALAQAMAHEHAAGEPQLAAEHLAEFLQLFAKTDYARPMVRERAAAIPLLTRFLETNPGLQLENLASELLMAARTAEDDEPPKLRAREFEVLRRLETQTDSQIAADLGITRAGVRYHVGHLFAKLGVHDRKAAVERVRSLGIV